MCIYHIVVIFLKEGCQYLIKHAHVAYTSKSTMFYMQNHGTQTLLLLFEVYIYPHLIQRVYTGSGKLVSVFIVYFSV